MAKRRIRAGLAGLGEGISNLGVMLLRQAQQDKSQKAYDDRAAANAAAVASRQDAAADQAAIQEVLDELAEGGDPHSAAARISMRSGRNVTASDLEGFRPSPRRRMEKATSDGIAKATKPEGVFNDFDIASIARAEGIGERFPGLPEFATDGMEPSSGPLAGLDPLAAEYGARAAQRRKSLESVPELVDFQDPVTGQKGKRNINKYDPALNDGITFGPTSEQAGALTGQQKTAELQVSGDALADQVTKEATARQAVELSPAAQSARTREAVNKEVATLRATLPIQLELAAKKGAAEIAQAVNKENAVNLASGTRAAQRLAPFFDRVSELTLSLNTEEAGVNARAQGAMLTAGSYLGMAPKVTELKQLIAQNARQLAIAMGVTEANVSERETVQALEGIGLSQWSTTSERRNALRNLQDLITLSPAVAARVPSNAGIGDRMAVAQQFMRARRSAEQEAIKAGAPVYLDPVTGGMTAVIQ